MKIGTGQTGEDGAARLLKGVRTAPRALAAAQSASTFTRSMPLFSGGVCTILTIYVFENKRDIKK
jgi:hypothetical protein